MIALKELERETRGERDREGDRERGRERGRQGERERSCGPPPFTRTYTHSIHSGLAGNNA